jgi:hypothetical protein
MLLLTASVTAETHNKDKNIKTFTLGFSVLSLPTINDHTCIYNYKMNNLYYKQIYSTGYKLRKKTQKRQQIKGIDKENVILAINYILDSKNNSSFTIFLSKQDKDSLINFAKQKNYLDKPLYSVDSLDLSKYIIDKDSIIIDFKEFNSEYSRTMEAFSSSIDGAPFSIFIKLVDRNLKNENYNYTGNLCDNVDDTKVDDFLVFYNMNRQYKIFDNNLTDRYFNTKNLYRIILRYIAYKENKVQKQIFKST